MDLELWLSELLRWKMERMCLMIMDIKVAEVGTTAGWQLADGTWYYYDAPGKPHNGWLDSKYYIDNGRMQTEDIVPAMGDTSREAYVGADGVIVQNGWVYERYGGSWFYSENGMLVEDGWKTINGKKYYFSSIFMNRLSFREIDGKLYEFDGSGACRGEIAKKNSWYQSPDGSWYWFNEDGTLNTEGTKKISEGNLDYKIEDEYKIQIKQKFERINK